MASASRMATAKASTASADCPRICGPDHPIVVAPGESLPIDVTFDPDAIGLQPGTMEILSDDPDTPDPPASRSWEPGWPTPVPPSTMAMTSSRSRRP